MPDSTLALTLLLLFLSTLPSPAHAASAIVQNLCSSPIHISVAKPGTFTPSQPIAAGGRFSEPISIPNAGISIKVSPTPNGKVAQFEYTLGNDGKLYYDVSNIDGNPFAYNGVSLAPAKVTPQGYPSCVVVDCPVGAKCHAAYNAPDDVRTKVCPAGVDLIFTVCTGNKIVGGGAAPAVQSSGTAKGANAGAVATPAVSPAATGVRKGRTGRRSA